MGEGRGLRRNPTPSRNHMLLRISRAAVYYPSAAEYQPVCGAFPASLRRFSTPDCGGILAALLIYPFNLTYNSR